MTRKTNRRAVLGAVLAAGAATAMLPVSAAPESPALSAVDQAFSTSGGDAPR